MLRGSAALICSLAGGTLEELDVRDSRNLAMNVHNPERVDMSHIDVTASPRVENNNVASIAYVLLHREAEL